TCAPDGRCSTTPISKRGSWRRLRKRSMESSGNTSIRNGSSLSRPAISRAKPPPPKRQHLELRRENEGAPTLIIGCSANSSASGKFARSTTGARNARALSRAALSHLVKSAPSLSTLRPSPGSTSSPRAARERGRSVRDQDERGEQDLKTIPS